MGRNTGGVYTLPGAAFVSGTVISSTAMNAKLADIAAALTDSLSRSGNGDMIAELRVPDGSAALPTLAWTNDPGTGFYLAATSSFRAVILAATVQEWTSAGVSIQKPLTVTDVTTLSSTLNCAAVSGSAALSASGTVRSTAYHLASGQIPSTTGANYALGSLSSNANGVNVISLGVRARTIDTVTDWRDVEVGIAYDVDASIASGSAVWLNPTGVKVESGDVATASTRVSALQVKTGDISLNGVVNPNFNVAISNTLTPANFDKAWAYVRSDGAGGAIVDNGFNIASAAIVGTAIQLNFATAFSGLDYACTLSTLGGAPRGLWFSTMTTTSIRLNVSDMAGVTTDLSTTAVTLMFRATGKQ